MKVEFLFSRNKKIGSKLIAWASKYENLDMDNLPSHMAVLIDETWVIESTLFTGVRIIPYTNWLLKNEELYKIKCPRDRESKHTLKTAFSVWGKGYDWFGIAYFAYSFLRLMFFKEPLPLKNKWQRNNKYFCTEYAGKLTGQDFSMYSPARICKEWLNIGDEK